MTNNDLQTIAWKI